MGDQVPVPAARYHRRATLLRQDNVISGNTVNSMVSRGQHYKVAMRVPILIRPLMCLGHKTHMNLHKLNHCSCACNELTLFHMELNSIVWKC